MTDVPNPGSDTAIDQGCTCPVLDNGHGLGLLGGIADAAGSPLFVMDVGCPLHGAGNWRDGE